MTLSQTFSQMGVRVKLKEFSDRFHFNSDQNIRIDIKKDSEGEFFEIMTRNDPSLQILDLQKQDRHLLLMVKDTTNNKKIPTQKFLCGHDERHWFTCAVPDTKVSSVSTAKQALKPQEVIDFEKREGVKTKDLHKRHKKLESGKKMHRQGEFMFLPTNFQPQSDIMILKKEPLQRGRSKPHMAEFLYRFGGETVYVNSSYPNGITQSEYSRLDKDSKRNFRIMRRNAKVYVKGRIRHPDHATIDLKNIWHQVAINTEDQAWGAKNVAFLD